MREIKFSSLAHVDDWVSRCETDEMVVEYVERGKRGGRVRMNDEALRDLISDAIYYAEEMDSENTGDIDYRPKARTALRNLEKAGVKWERKGFRITLV